MDMFEPLRQNPDVVQVGGKILAGLLGMLVGAACAICFSGSSSSFSSYSIAASILLGVPTFAWSESSCMSRWR